MQNLKSVLSNGISPHQPKKFLDVGVPGYLIRCTVFFVSIMTGAGVAHRIISPKMGITSEEVLEIENKVMANKQKIADFRREQALHKEKVLEQAKRNAENVRAPTIEELEKAAAINKAERQAKITSIISPSNNNDKNPKTL